MEQELESERKFATVEIEANEYLQERRVRIVQEQRLEIESRRIGELRVTFRRTDEEERLMSLLSKQTE
jgi:hypothetical protein